MRGLLERTVSWCRLACRLARYVIGAGLLAWAGWQLLPWAKRSTDPRGVASGTGAWGESYALRTRPLDRAETAAARRRERELAGQPWA